MSAIEKEVGEESQEVEMEILSKEKIYECS